MPHLGFLSDLCLMAARMDKFNLAESKAIHNYSRKNFHQISWNELTEHAEQSGAVEACWAHNPEVRRSKLRSAK